jgi:hypothetical protein
MLTAEIIIQRKRDEGNGTGWFLRYGCLLQSGPGEFLQMNRLVDDDVLGIVINKRHLEAVGIENGTEDGKQ